MKKIEVAPAKDGKKPMFFGGGGNIHPQVRQKMMEVIFNDTQFDFLDEESVNGLAMIRSEFSAFRLNDLTVERPVLARNKTVDLFTFTGTRINRTLQLLFSIAGMKAILDESNSSLSIESTYEDLVIRWKSLSGLSEDIDPYISDALETNPVLLDFSKWGRVLPRHLQVKLLKERYYSIDETKEFVEKIALTGNG